MSNTEIAKIFQARCDSFIKYKNEHNLNNVLTDPSDHNGMMQHLKDVLDVCPTVGELHARGLLITKGIKMNRQRIQNLLKQLKGSSPLSMIPERQR